MKYLMTVLVLFIATCLSAEAVDYLMDTISAHQSCLNGNEAQCKVAYQKANSGINYYAPIKRKSVENYRNYCVLLGVRVQYALYTNPQLAQSDVAKLHTECLWVGN